MAKKKKMYIKQKLGNSKIFEKSEISKAKYFFTKWKKKGYRIFDIGEGSHGDYYTLIAAKRKPSKNDLEELGHHPLLKEYMTEIEKKRQIK